MFITKLSVIIIAANNPLIQIIQIPFSQNNHQNIVYIIYNHYLRSELFHSIPVSIFKVLHKSNVLSIT